MDLSLVPIYEIIEEIGKRKGAYVVGYTDYIKGEKIIKTFWDGDYDVRCGVAAVLLHDAIATSTEEPKDAE